MNSNTLIIKKLFYSVGNTIEQQKSIDFFDSNVHSEIHEGIIDALDESDDYKIEIKYGAVDRKFTRSRHLKDFNTVSEEIIVAQIEPWFLLDDGFDISVEQLEAMNESEKKVIVANWAYNMVCQYDYDIEQARRLISGYEV